MAAGILGWAVHNYQGSVSVLQIVVFVLLLLNGTFLHYLVRMLFILPVFWVHSVHGFQLMFLALIEFMDKPDRIFSGGLRVALLTIIPLSLIAAVPSHVIFEGLRPLVIAHLLAITVILFSFVLLIWNRALAAYSSASS